MCERQQSGRGPAASHQSAAACSKTGRRGGWKDERGVNERARGLEGPQAEGGSSHTSTPSALARRRRRRRPSTASALRMRGAAAARPARAHLGDLVDLAGGQVVHAAHDLELALLHQALQHGRHLRGAGIGGSKGGAGWWLVYMQAGRRRQRRAPRLGAPSATPPCMPHRPGLLFAPAGEPGTPPDPHAPRRPQRGTHHELLDLVLDVGGDGRVDVVGCLGRRGDAAGRRRASGGTRGVLRTVPRGTVPRGYPCRRRPPAATPTDMISRPPWERTHPHPPPHTRGRSLAAPPRAHA